MKKVFFGLIAVAFISLSSFTSVNSNEDVLHNCRYRVYNANTGQTLGYVNINDMPDNVGCGSQVALNAALASWQAMNP
ncbi:hypothetical protein FLGE108171_15365 [Flavobacterium gelidilacus]|jgi:hypothetical protein|uniref:hypothetical protein n=1 Tax=Flavobacterium gelidilacus TaxID=206041 RepID=UPI00041E33F1|nr:hypothetical protein [Flavobacterium gelidilacus]